MSLRIYIKGNNSNNKLGSPNKTSASASQLPQFNQLPPSRIPKPGKKALQRDSSSKDNSAILESPPQENEYAFRSFGENSHSTPALAQKVNVSHQNDRYFENSRNDAEIHVLPRSKQEIQKDKQAFAKKMLNRTSLSDRQLRTTVQECDNIIMALFEETEKLHDLYSQKTKEVEVFRDLDNSFNLNKTSKMEESDITRLKKENVRLIEMVRRLTDSNTELTEENSILREMASSSEQTLQKERESFKALREKAEALVVMNDELNARLDEKENEVANLNANLQNLILELRAKDQALEEYKKYTLLGQAQPSFRNSTGGGGENFGSAQKSGSSSALATDWQNKFETSKAENAKLLKIIEGNQQVIKDLKQTLSNLETRSAQRFEEIKSLYENKIKPVSAAKRIEVQGETPTKTLPPPTSSASSYHHSQKPSYDHSTWKGLGQMY